MNGAVVTVRGRALSTSDLDLIREIAAQPGQTRRAISVAVCEALGWVQPSGRPWDMACRYLLLRLQAQGLLTLPNPRMRHGKRRPIALTSACDPQTPVTAPVHALGSLSCHRVDGTALAPLWNEYIARYHYLGLGTLVGPHLRYLVSSGSGYLAALGFCGAAWALRPRDVWIGWSPTERRARLPHVVNQARFLILPWVRSKNLASHLLSLSARCVVRDWQETYGLRPLLIETFVDARRFVGTCYRAANWLHLGQTQGRGKMDRHTRRELPIKDLYIYPLHPRARQLLRQT